MSEVSFSLFWDQRLHDWTDIDYSSYLDTTYQMVNDNTFWLSSPYLFLFLEDGLDPGNTDNSLLTQVAWDWSAADD